MVKKHVAAREYHHAVRSFFEFKAARGGGDLLQNLLFALEKEDICMLYIRVQWHYLYRAALRVQFMGFIALHMHSVWGLRFESPLLLHG